VRDYVRFVTVQEGGRPVRKLTPPGEARGGPDVERAGDRVVVRSFPLARDVLRDEEGMHQGGFGVETLRRSQLRPPVLYLEGAEHRTQRRAVARYFTPKAVEGYRPMMAELSERLLASLRLDQSTDLSALSMRMAVEVAGQVVGLTNSSVPAMTRRLAAFFRDEPTVMPRSLPGAVRFVRTQAALLGFYLLDVKPAIRARRRRRRDDVISTTLDAGFSDLEVLTEAITYGAAGMVTTRELITVGAWHLMTDPALLERFRAASGPERTAIVEELLRLEPVVGHLLRRAQHAVTLEGANGPVEVRPGDLVDVDLRAVNADPAAAGPDGLSLCPGRPLGKGTQPSVMSLGDGHHRCPGGPIAVMETEVFLSALLRRDVVADGPPRVRWNPVTQGYDLDRLMVRLVGDAPLRPPSGAGSGA